MDLTHYSTFTGIAGFDLAAEEAGFRTIGQVEKNPYRQKVLRKYWPDVPLWEDIRDVTEESLKEKGILADAQFDGRAEGREGGRPRGLAKKKGEEGKAGDKPAQATQYSSQDATRRAKTREISSVTLVTGGFPCQGFSVAGKRRGKADDRYLWPEMFRVIKILRPNWVLAENVAGIVRMALDTVLSDLESEGYSAQALVVPACAVNAPHRRDRVWIVAHSGDKRRGGWHYGDAEGAIGPLQAEGSSPADEQGLLAYTKGGGLRPQLNKITDKLLSENRSSQEPEGGGGYVPDADIQGFQNEEGGKDDARASGLGTPGLPGWWEFEPDMGRVADGVPHRVDRLSALGDAIVPQVAYRILKAIAKIEKSIKYS